MTSEIHPTAIVEDGAIIGNRVKIGAYSIIGRMARIGDGSVIGSHCEIAMQSGVLEEGPLVLGENSLIRSGSIFYQNSRFGDSLSTGHRVTVREGVSAGLNLQIGTLSDVQGHCSIGDFVRFHSNVHVGQKTEIGSFVWIFPYVVLTNDPHPPSESLSGCKVGDFAVIATMSTILPGVQIGAGALVGAMSLVREDLPNDMICVGVPGKAIAPISKIKFKDTGKQIYPWRRHFHRGYPRDVVDLWKEEFPNG
jgi:acyl-[acyl carrier protein]--UDP-N-acetylglucosamine O-acyltransferase